MRVSRQIVRSAMAVSTAMEGFSLPLRQPQQQARFNSSWYRSESNFDLITPLSRREAQELLDTNSRFRQAAQDFTTYRDIVEGELGGPRADLVDKAIQLDYGLRLRSRMHRQAQGLRQNAVQHHKQSLVNSEM